MSRRDPRQARFLTWSSLRWVVRHRAWGPYYLIRYWRFAWLRLRHRDVVTEGFVFLGKDVRIDARRGFGRILLGRWVHLGDGNRLRAHEGTLRIGDKCVFGANNVINAYLDVEIGPRTIVADWVYVVDFDHVFDDLHQPIKDQGIAKSPVRIGADCWLGTKCTVTRGVRIGQGVVVGANAVVTSDVPDFAVVGGVPARLIKDRVALFEAQAQRRAALADIAAKTARAADAANEAVGSADAQGFVEQADRRAAEGEHRRMESR
jgi:acetyltransferase-like isoleucine patch superfamily enzyme